MKESDIKKQFERAGAAFAKKLDDTYAATYLNALRDAVRELQDGGMNVSLEVRLRREGNATPRSETPLANATTVFDGMQLDWLVLYNYTKAALIAYDGAVPVADFESERRNWSGAWPAPPTPGAVSLKQAIMNVLIDNTAERQAIMAYNVPATGVTGMLDKKPIAPAMKLSAP